MNEPDKLVFFIRRTNEKLMASRKIDQTRMYRIDIKTGEKEKIGEPGFTYGISRTFDEQNGTRYTGNDSLYIRDGKIYVLGYEKNDLEDPNAVSAVHKWDLKNQSQTRLTPPTEQFWLIDEDIYFIDSDTGHLQRVDMDGSNLQTLTERAVMEAQFYDNQFYYRSHQSLYAYHIEQEQETKLSEEPVQSFYVNQTGVYYVSDGLEVGLYKINRDHNHRNVRLVHDRIDTVQLADEGIVYTLKYEPGIFNTGSEYHD